MVTRKYSTTEKRIWQRTWFSIMLLVVGALSVAFAISMDGYVYRLESMNSPSDFPDLSHEVVETVQVEEIGKTGMASWYDYGLKNFPNYSKNNFTAASRDYPRGTKLKVCRIDKTLKVDEIGFSYGAISYEAKNPDLIPYTEFVKCVEVWVNDYVENPGVIIDLSSAAFKELAPLSRGLVEVKVFKIEK